MLKVYILSIFCLSQGLQAAIYRPLCEDTPSLIAAIVAANASANDDIIDLGGCIYTLVEAHNANNGLPVIPSTATSGKLSIINGSIERSREVTVPPIPNFRFLVVNSGADLSLFNLTLDFGSITDGAGGAIYNQGSLSLENCTLSNNTSLSGGAIFNADPGVIKAIESSVISGNIATVTGGDVTVGGGGIYNISTITTINNSTFSHNDVTATNDGVTGVATSLGGGIYNDGIITSISNSTFSDNSSNASSLTSIPTASSQGGGIFNSGTIISIINNTISFNIVTSTSGAGASSQGGGIYNVGSIGIDNNTIFGNTLTASIGSSQGGGIFNADTISSLFSNIVALNIVDGNTTSGPDIDSPDLGTDEGYNLLSNAADSGITDGENHDIVTSDPILLGLDQLQDNGGFTYTIALKPGSLAINNGLNPYGLSFDQRGRPFKRIACSRPDIGAFEFSKCHLLGDPVGE